jgi:Domain of Unknown Function (DUF1080)
MKIPTLLATFAVLSLSLLHADSQSAPPTHKVEKPINYVLDQPDPIVGDWQGSDVVVAQVFKGKDGQYQANLLTAFDTEGNVITTLQRASSADGETFTGNGWNGVISGSQFSLNNGDKKYSLSHVTRVSPTLGAKPPPGAVVLFDGSNLDEWAKKAGKDWLTEDGPAKWKLVDGVVEIVPGTDCIITHKKFGDCHLHVEFRTISAPTKSAVFLETRYEVNINESYGRLDGTTSGGLDNTSKDVPPRVRPSLPPLSWQTFDIDFTAPRFDAAGKKTANANITVLLNGVKLCDHKELDAPFGAAGRLGEAPTGPIMLQDHTTPCQFRNIWLVEK